MSEKARIVVEVTKAGPEASNSSVIFSYHEGRDSKEVGQTEKETIAKFFAELVTNLAQAKDVRFSSNIVPGYSYSVELDL